MSIIRTLGHGMVPVALAVSIGFSAGPAQAAAPANGCPPSYQLLSVEQLSAQGYQVPAQVDSSTSGILSFGRVGNDDGWVCALPLGNQQTSFGGQVYNFWDNTLLGS